MKPDIRFEIRLNQTETSSASRTAYDTIYDDGDISQTDSFYLWIGDLLQLRPGEKYLDISCGRGQVVQLAAQSGATAFGLDLSHVALVSGRPAEYGIGLTTGNSQQLPFADNSFDVMSNIGSIEHYVDMPQAVREMSRTLKPSGRAIILVPNSFSLLHNILLAYKTGRTIVDNQPIQRYAARAEWQDLLEENGLKVQKTLRYEIERPRTSADWQHYFRHPKKLVRLLVKPFIPLNLSFCFIYICQKASV